MAALRGSTVKRGLMGLTLAAGLAGCASTSGVNDTLTTATLAKSQTSVALLKAEVVGSACKGGTLIIGRKKGEQSYQEVKTLQTITGGWFNSGNDVMQVNLAPGQYHVLQFTCGYQIGNRIYTLTLGGKEGAGLFGFGGKYKKSFAEFQLGAGEIVNLGYLKIVSSGFGSAFLNVTDLPEKSLARFKKEKPNLAAQMKTRLLKVNAVPRSPEQQKKFCDVLIKLNELLGAAARPLPAECSGAGAGLASAANKQSQ